MKDPVIYRTSNPDVIADYKKVGEEYLEWCDRCVAFAESIHPDANPMKSSDFGGERFGGLTVVKPIPEGWRVQKQTGWLADIMVPRRANSKHGKKIAKDVEQQYDALREAPNVRKTLTGMPSYLFLGLSGQAPGVVLYDDTLYVDWNEDALQMLEKEVDTSIWERVKLSDYYAIKEAHNREEANA